MSAIAIDVADGFRDAWAANAALITIIPVARCFFLKAPAVTTVPYAVFTIEPIGEPQYSTGTTTYITDVILRISVFGTGLVSSLQSAMAAIQNVYKSTFTISSTTMLATFLADAGKVEVDGERDGETVYRCDMSWRFMLTRNDS